MREIRKIQDRLAKKGVSDFEIFFGRSRGVTLEVEDQCLDSHEVENEMGYAIRVIKDGRMGFAYGTDLASIDWVVDSAQKSAYFEEASQAWGFSKVYPKVSNWDDSFLASDQEKIDRVRSMEAKAKSVDPRIEGVKQASYSDGASEITLAYSDGRVLHHEFTSYEMSLMVIARDSDSQTTFDSISSPFLKDLDGTHLATSTAKRALELLGGHRIKNYKGPIVLDRMVMTEIIGLLAPSTTVDNIHKKNSFLVGKKGQKIYSDLVTLIDDGVYRTGCNSRPFDAEGSASQTTLVVNQGTVQQFLYDAYWAGREGENSTGNAVRQEFLSRPKLNISNFYLKPGTASLGELFKKMENGIYVSEAIGMHTADPISGNFSVGIQGQVIKNGKKAASIRSMALTGNLHELLNRVVAVGSDLKFHGDCGAPSVLFSQAEISGES